MCHATKISMRCHRRASETKDSWQKRHGHYICVTRQNKINTNDGNNMIWQLFWLNRRLIVFFQYTNNAIHNKEISPQISLHFVKSDERWTINNFLRYSKKATIIDLWASKQNIFEDSLLLLRKCCSKSQLSTIEVRKHGWKSRNDCRCSKEICREEKRLFLAFKSHLTRNIIILTVA